MEFVPVFKTRPSLVNGNEGRARVPNPEPVEGRAPSVLLICTYDLGRQPLGLASPAARIRDAGIDASCVDVSRQELLDDTIASASLIAFYLPMHTATRLAAPLIQRARRVNPAAMLAAYGLYAPLNAGWLREQGVDEIIEPEREAALVDLARGATAAPADALAPRRAVPVVPDRAGLPPLARYASLQMPDGRRRVTGSTDATRGCKHLCRHCPIVPVYNGVFRAVPLDVVMEDVRAQVAAGAEHITFGDPDFLNGPTHARRLVERLHREHPSLSYDVTIKIEHLLAHRDVLPLLRDTGCLFVTSAVESIDDAVLERLQKGHSSADFTSAVALCREAGVILSPTFVPFTPWTTIPGYLELLDRIEALDLIGQVAPVQLAIRLLVTGESRLLELEEIRDLVEPFDPGSLTWPWRHSDPAVDRLQRDVFEIVSRSAAASRPVTFDAIRDRACAYAGRPAPPRADGTDVRAPMLTEPWYCCAEPVDSPL